MDITFLSISALAVAKIFVLVALGIYIIFALVVIKQVSLMVSTIGVGLESFMKFVALAHLIFAVIIFLSAMIIL